MAQGAPRSCCRAVRMDLVCVARLCTDEDVGSINGVKGLCIRPLTLYLGNKYEKSGPCRFSFVASYHRDPTIGPVMGQSAARRRSGMYKRRRGMRSRQFATMAAMCGAAALLAWETPRFSLDSLAVEDAATAIKDADVTGSVMSLGVETRLFDTPFGDP